MHQIERGAHQTAVAVLFVCGDRLGAAERKWDAGILPALPHHRRCRNHDPALRILDQRDVVWSDQWMAPTHLMLHIRDHTRIWRIIGRATKDMGKQIGDTLLIGGG